MHRSQPASSFLNALMCALFLNHPSYTVLHIGRNAWKEAQTVRLGFDSISIPFLAGQKRTAATLMHWRDRLNRAPRADSERLKATSLKRERSLNQGDRIPLSPPYSLSPIPYAAPKCTATSVPLASNSASGTALLVPILPAPTARLNDSSKPPYASGPTFAITSTLRNRFCLQVPGF
jgi:hypothetical protein